VTFKVAYRLHVRKSLYDELHQNSNIDLCHLTICIYNPIFWLFKPGNPARLVW